jgi:hypothetical protein
VCIFFLIDELANSTNATDPAMAHRSGKGRAAIERDIFSSVVGDFARLTDEGEKVEQGTAGSE